MSDSDELKQTVADYFGDMPGAERSLLKWKRTLKTKYNHRRTDGSVQVLPVREFKCPNSAAVRVVGEPDNCLMMYGTSVVFKTGSSSQCGLWVVLCTEEFWRAKGHIYDGHIDLIMYSLGLPADYYEEMESTFSCPAGFTEHQVKQQLTALGFKEEPNLV